MHEARLFEFAERPEALGVLRNVIGQGTGLEMRGAVDSVLLDKVQLKMAFAVEHDTFICECGEGFSPEVEAEAPFAAIEFGPVKLVAPDEFPVFVFGQKAVRMIFNFEFFHDRYPSF